MGRIKAALFDLDGTLLDTEPLYAEAAQVVIDEHGDRRKYDWDVMGRVVGRPELEGARVIVDEFGLAARGMTPERYLELRNEVLWETFPKCRAMPGAIELTRRLGHNGGLGLKIAVATSSWKGLLGRKLALHGDWFASDIDAIVTGDDPRIKRGKPNPDIFLTAAADLGVRPEECAIFEDAVSGLRAALAAGAGVVVGVPDRHIRDAVASLDPRIVILNSLMQFDTAVLF